MIYALYDKDKNIKGYTNKPNNDSQTGIDEKSAEWTDFLEHLEAFGFSIERNTPDKIT